MKKTTMKRSIYMKCYDCCYDADAGGKTSIRDCKDVSCALWAYRPMARLDKYKSYTYEGFDLNNKNDIRGKWISKDLSDKEIQEVKNKSEIAKLRFLAINETAKKNET